MLYYNRSKGRGKTPRIRGQEQSLPYEGNPLGTKNPKKIKKTP